MKKYCKKIILFSIIILFLINWAYYSTFTLNSFYKYDLLDSVSSLELVHFVNNEPKESRVIYEKNSINIFFEELKKHKYMKPEFTRYFKNTKIPDPWTGFSILGYDKNGKNIFRIAVFNENIISIGDERNDWHTGYSVTNPGIDTKLINKLFSEGNSLKMY